MTFTQEQFERLSNLMIDKGVVHEAFELLADLRHSELLAKQEVVAITDSIVIALAGVTDFEGLPVSELNYLQVIRKLKARIKNQLTWRKVKEELPKRDERVWCKDLRGSIRDATFTRHNHAWIFVCSAGYVLDLRNVASWLPIIKETTDD